MSVTFRGVWTPRLQMVLSGHLTVGGTCPWPRSGQAPCRGNDHLSAWPEPSSSPTCPRDTRAGAALGRGSPVWLPPQPVSLRRRGRGHARGRAPTNEMPQRLAAMDSALRPPRTPRWNLALSCYGGRGKEKNPLASRSPRHGDRVDVVGDQAAGPDLDAPVRTPLGHLVEVGLVVPVAEEGLLATVPALGHMVGHARCHHTGDSGHASIVAIFPRPVNNFVGCPPNSGSSPTTARSSSPRTSRSSSASAG